MSFLAFLPTSNITGIGNGPYGDYYMDVASIGLSISLVSAASWLMSATGRFAKAAFALGIALLLLRCGAVAESARWAHLWADGERAYKSTVATFPEAYYGYIVYAQTLCDRNDFSGAAACCDAAERLVAADAEKMSSVDLVRAICTMRGEKDADKSLHLLAKCERGNTSPAFVRSCHFYRGCVAEDLMNDLAFAQREYEAAMPAKLGSDDIRAADRLARLYAISGNVSAAIEVWRAALHVSPNDFGMMWNLSIALREIGEIEAADRIRRRAEALAKPE